MAERRRTFRCGPVWDAAKAQAEHHGDTLSEVARAALCAYLRDRDTYWAAVTPPAVDGPAQPAFSHQETVVKPWKWDRPLGYGAQTRS